MMPNCSTTDRGVWWPIWTAPDPTRIFVVALAINEITSAGEVPATPGLRWCSAIQYRRYPAASARRARSTVLASACRGVEPLETGTRSRTERGMRFVDISWKHIHTTIKVTRQIGFIGDIVTGMWTAAAAHAVDVSVALDDRRRPVTADVLDNLVWHALTTSHQRFAEGNGPVRRYDPDVTSFVAINDTGPDAWKALEDLVGPGRIIVLVRSGGIDPPADWTRIGAGFGNQMIADRLVPRPEIADTIEPLTSEHVPQMLALVEVTQPGPFRPRTIELGHYFGVFVGGRLVAMAGERLQTPEFTEVSAVCTHPQARGRGLASALTHHVASGIVDRGQTPILHVAQTNVDAQRVYERLGFRVRTALEFVAVQTPSA
jgi:ribosomal protein S18 acetylase RimI-like enzyme